MMTVIFGLTLWSDNGITNFVVVGDIGTTKHSFETLKNIESINPEVILFVGDLSYTLQQEWFDMSDFLGVERTFISLGNHELEFNQKAEPWFEHYDLPVHFYSIDYKNIHYVALSMYTDYSKESEQYKFLENDLRSANTNPDIDWILVFFHEPIYTNDHLDLTPNSKSTIGPLTEFRNVMQPLFDLYNVDLVLQGHFHAYERTLPLMFNNTITDYSTHSYIDPEGQIYVTVGTGGRKMHDFKPEIAEWTAMQYNQEYGFLNLIWSENGKKMSGEFITNSGKVADSFQICLENETTCSFFHK